MATKHTRTERSAGSIYDGKSPAGQVALAQLRAILQDSGFYCEKERRTETTLRVYPERRGHYPLLNPRFVRARARSQLPISGPSIVCSVFSDHDESITRVLEHLPQSEYWSFHPFPRPPRRGRYRLHGDFIIPLS